MRAAKDVEPVAALPIQRFGSRIHQQRVGVTSARSRTSAVRRGCVARDFLVATADREDFFASRTLADATRRLGYPPTPTAGAIPCPRAGLRRQTKPTRQIGLVVVMEQCEVNPRASPFWAQSISRRKVAYSQVRRAGRRRTGASHQPARSF